MSLRIIHIITSLQRGGAEVALSNLLAELQLQTQDQHIVIFFHDGPIRNDIENLGIPCYRVAAWGSYANPLFMYRLIKVIKRYAPHCLHTDLWAANLLGRICAKLLVLPCVSVLHALTEHEGRLRTFIDRLVPVSPTTYIAVSQSVYQSLIDYRRYKNTACTIILNGIDHKSVMGASSNTRQYIPASITSMTQETYIIGTVGRLIRDKNYHVLLESFSHIIKKYPHARLIIVGSGPEERNLKLLAEKLGITKYITWIVGQRSYPYYPFFDCYVQPSRYEGLSIALLEALCFSLPVIVTGNNEQHEVIRHKKNGLVIEPNNIEAITQSIIWYIENKQLCNTLGQNGFTTVTQQFSMTTTAAQYQKLFEQVTL